MKDFNEIVTTVTASDEYFTFTKEHPDYYLAHGFIQLDAQFTPTSNWQVGFYSEKKDNLAIFETNPVKLKGTEEAFKEGGIIDKLSLPEISTKEAITTLTNLLKETYPEEQPTSIIFIIQSIAGQALYNITVVTKTFSMIITRIDAHSGEIISHDKRSLLDLKKDDE